MRALTRGGFRRFAKNEKDSVRPWWYHGSQMPRSAVLGLLLLVPFVGSASGRAGERACKAIVVAEGAVSYPHVRSLQAAVGRARSCDWILVAPGIYRGPVTIRIPGLHLRGLDRNRVVVDGGHRVGNGITVAADGVSIENLTVRNFDRRSANDDSTGTQVRWDGVHGWRGLYLTTYDTGRLGGYGLWASRSSGGELDHVYASGFDDSGLYVGACRDCRTLVERAVAEHNLIGLAATNASGHFLIERTLLRGNAVGASLNSSTSDPPPPQLGTCDAGANRSPAPLLTTTRLARCTVFRGNTVLGNNALDVPTNTASVRPGAGIGIDLLGSYGDLIVDNQISGNRNIGLLGLPLPIRGRARFALAGNRISANRITGSRIAIALGGADSSRDNCLDANLGAHTTEPPDLRPLSCTRATTPGLRPGSSSRVLAFVARLHAQLARHAHRGQPPPLPQPTMPAPCRAAPPSPVCPR